MSVRYSDAAPVLYEQGWGTPVPSDPESKRPLLPNWSYYCRNEAQPQQIELWASKWPDANTAIAVSAAAGVAYLDIDFDEAGAAMVARSAANEYMGHTSHIRVGREPRQVRMYRLADSVEDIDRPGLELKAGGVPGLITLFGIHAGTGLPYYWPDQHPLDTTPDDLPTITAAAVDAMLGVLTPFIGVRANGHGVVFDQQPAAPLLSAIADNPDVPPLDLLASVMAGAVEGCRRSTMFGTVVAAVMSGFGDAETTEALLPIYRALHPQREHRETERAFRDALAWIRKRRPTSRHDVAEIVKRAPWARRARGEQ